jgi:menaquinone-dependent protoporphyrinogen oxidase
VAADVAAPTVLGLETSMDRPRILVVYHSAEGQTARIADRLRAVLEEDGLDVTCLTTDAAPPPDGFDGVVVGDSIHAGEHSKQLTSYVTEHVERLNALPAALFQVSLTSADESPESAAEAGGLVAKLLDATGFDPDLVARFAGALAYTRYGWMKRRLMHQIMKRDGGETDTSRDHEYTDWDAVEGFARDVASYVRSADQT